MFWAMKLHKLGMFSYIFLYKIVKEEVLEMFPEGHISIKF